AGRGGFEGLGRLRPGEGAGVEALAEAVDLTVFVARDVRVRVRAGVRAGVEVLPDGPRIAERAVDGGVLRGIGAEPGAGSGGDAVRSDGASGLRVALRANPGARLDPGLERSLEAVVDADLGASPRTDGPGHVAVRIGGDVGAGAVVVPRVSVEEPEALVELAAVPQRVAAGDLLADRSVVPVLRAARGEAGIAEEFLRPAAVAAGEPVLEVLAEVVDDARGEGQPGDRRGQGHQRAREGHREQVAQKVQQAASVPGGGLVLLLGVAADLLAAALEVLRLRAQAGRDHAVPEGAERRRVRSHPRHGVDEPGGRVGDLVDCPRSLLEGGPLLPHLLGVAALEARHHLSPEALVVLPDRVRSRPGPLPLSADT